MGGALSFRHKQRPKSFISYTIVPPGNGEDQVAEVPAPKGLQNRHLSACFVTVGDSVVAIGGYNSRDKRKSVRNLCSC